MKRLALIVLAALALAAPAAAANQPSGLLDGAASEIAGRPVTVFCETSWREWIANGDAAGFDDSGWAGYTFPTTPGSDSVIYLAPDECHLLTFAAVYKLGGDGVGIAEGSYAVHAFVHEAVHLLLHSPDEHAVDCKALTLDEGIAEKWFGLAPTVTTTAYRVVRRNHKIIAVRPFQVTGPNPLIDSFVRFDQRWHDALPAPYSGPCS